VAIKKYQYGKTQLADYKRIVQKSAKG